MRDFCRGVTKIHATLPSLAQRYPKCSPGIRIFDRGVEIKARGLTEAAGRPTRAELDEDQCFQSYENMTCLVAYPFHHMLNDARRS